MKEMNWSQWHSWRPRRPSARLKRRIFPARRGGVEAPSPAWFLGWLAPAAACLLLAFATLRTENGFSSAPAIRPATLAMVLSNQSYLAYEAGGLQSARNRPTALAFDWTNRGLSASNVHFAPLNY